MAKDLSLYDTDPRLAADKARWVLKWEGMGIERVAVAIANNSREVTDPAHGYRREVAAQWLATKLATRDARAVAADKRTAAADLKATIALCISGLALLVAAAGTFAKWN